MQEETFALYLLISALSSRLMVGLEDVRIDFMAKGICGGTVRMKTDGVYDSNLMCAHITMLQNLCRIGET